MVQTLPRDGRRFRKLTDAQVRDIRKYRDLGLTLDQIRTRMGNDGVHLSRANIGRICRRESYREII